MRSASISLIGVLLFFFVISAAYTVPEGTQAIVTQFGRPIGDPVTEAGLKFKTPFIQTVRRFEKRVMEWDGDPKQVTTKDKKFIEVDTTARWRIQDPLTFLQTVGTQPAAQTRLDDILDATVREGISGQNLLELVRSSNRELPKEENLAEGEEATDFGQIQVGRAALTERIFKEAAEQVREYGIELIDLRIKHINYVEEVRLKVYDRMVSERHKIAERLRSEGQGKSSEIDGLRERKLAEIRSGAYRRAEEIRGQAEADATRIYAEAYQTDPEFFAFVESLKAYREILDQDTLLMLSTDSELLQYLGGGSGMGPDKK